MCFTARTFKQVHFVGWLCLLIAIAGVCLPIVFKPFPMGDDFAFHMGNWCDVQRHWSEGVVFPSWNGIEAFGLGEPTHLFYPPFSSYLGAVSVWILGPTKAPALFIGLCILIAGYSMRSFAAEYLTAEQSWLAAILYALNPYFFLDIRIRSAFAEALALSFLPLLFKPLLRLRDASDSVMLGLMFSLQAFCNFPAAAIAGYSIAIVVVLRFAVERRPRALLLGLLGTAFGILSSSAVTLPVFFERNNVQLAVTLGFDWHMFFLPSRNMLFSVPMLLLAVTVLGTQFFGRLYSGLPELRLLFVFSNVVLLFLTRLSSPFYESLPLLAYIQFPWRWLAVLAFAASIMLTGSVQMLRTVQKTGAIVVLPTATVILLCSSFLLSPRGPHPWRGIPWGSQLSLATLRRPIHEYLPYKVSEYRLKSISAQASSAFFRTPGLVVERWDTESKRFSIDTPAPASLLVPVLQYPGWEVFVDAHPALITRDPETGLIRVDVSPGRHAVEVFFSPGRSRFYGFVITVTLLVGAIVFLWRSHSVGTSAPSLRTGSAQAG